MAFVEAGDRRRVIAVAGGYLAPGHATGHREPPVGVVQNPAPGGRMGAADRRWPDRSYRPARPSARRWTYRGRGPIDRPGPRRLGAREGPDALQRPVGRAPGR